LGVERGCVRCSTARGGGDCGRLLVVVVVVVGVDVVVVLGAGGGGSGVGGAGTVVVPVVGAVAPELGAVTVGSGCARATGVKAVSASSASRASVGDRRFIVSCRAGS
jgi:hypothetical protein